MEITHFFSTFSDIEQLSQQLMVRLSAPLTESSTIFIDDPTIKNIHLDSRQIEVRCVYLDDILGKIFVVCAFNSFTITISYSTNHFTCITIKKIILLLQLERNH